MGSFAGLLTLLFAMFTCGRSKEPITCDAGQFTAGQTATVTCNFHHYINHTRHRIFVLHYPFSAPDHFSGETVLKCRHLHRQKPHCMMAEGYQFNNIITNHMTLRIPEVKKAFAGRYVCQIVPHDGGPIKTCNLTVDGTIFTRTTADTTQPDTDSKTLNMPALGLYVSMAVVIVTLPCSIAYLAIRMQKLERRPTVTGSASRVSGHKRGDPACQAVAMESEWDRPPGLGAVDHPLVVGGHAPLADDDHDDDNDDDERGSDAESEKFEHSVLILPPPIASSTPALLLSTPLPAASSNAKKNGRGKGNKDKDRQARDAASHY
ncbi:uncharacterized protein [Littorina saxatilis]|uniref:uncharacterized protein n=1 Tax=Littorina saxatilis TaxID=31220 RepID=UPI0038B428CB